MKYSYEFRSESGDRAESSDAIVPIIKQVDGKFKLVGTGFFISRNGIFVTAKHVLQDVLDDDGKATCPIGIVQFLPNNAYLLRPIIRSCSNTVSDISVGVLAEVKHKKTGKILENRVLTLTFGEQKIGERVVTNAYPESTIEIDDADRQIMRLKTKFYDGVIEEYYPKGRDSSLLPFPCYRSSIKLLGGSSGGPVANEEGRVFAINCTGYDGIDDLSFLVRINEIIPLYIDNAVLNGKQRKRISVKELINLEHISTVPIARFEL